jgi:hypothetical protein
VRWPCLRVVAALLAAIVTAAPAAAQEGAPAPDALEAPSPGETRAQPGPVEQQPTEPRPANAPSELARPANGIGAEVEIPLEDIDDITETPSAPAATNGARVGRGFLGHDPVVDSLALLAAAVLGGALGAMSAYVIAAQRKRGNSAELQGGGSDERVIPIGTKGPQPGHGQPDRTGRQEAVTRAAHDDDDDVETDQPKHTPSVSHSSIDEGKRDARQRAPQFGGGREQEQEPEHESGAPARRGSDQHDEEDLRAVHREFNALIGQRGTKPSQFADLIRRFARVHAVQVTHQGMSAQPYRGNEANQLIVALGNGDVQAVFPTYEYVSNFPVAFGRPGDNPEEVRQLFELQADDSGQLRVIEPARVEIGAAGSVTVKRRGRLSGFRS